MTSSASESAAPFFYITIFNRLFMNKTLESRPDVVATSANASLTTPTKALLIHVPFGQASTATLVRPLGAIERMLHRHSEGYPIHFSVAAELTGAFTPSQLQAALAAVQQRHPLLRVHIEDQPGTRLGFYQPAVVPAIPLAVFEASDGYTWQQLAATEVSRRFDPRVAPLVRAVLLRQGPTVATLILSFDHTVADGLSAVFVLEDILAVLNGRELAALPTTRSQEEWLAALPSGLPTGDAPAPAPPVDERLSALVNLAPFTGAAPDLSTLTLNEAFTSRLVQRCRTEQTTVHAALVAATTQVLMKAGHREVVRVFSPFNFRKLLGEGMRDCGVYFNAARTGFLPEQTQDFWELARLTSAALAQARSEAGTRGVSAAIAQFIPAEVTPEAATGFVQQALSCETLMSNLGVLDIPASGAVQAAAVWGPIMLGRFQDESMLGIATLHGQLRLACASPAPIPNFLPLIQAQLAVHLGASAIDTQGIPDTGYLLGLMAQETSY